MIFILRSAVARLTLMVANEGSSCSILHAHPCASPGCYVGPGIAHCMGPQIIREYTVILSLPGGRVRASVLRPSVLLQLEQT